MSTTKIEERQRGSSKLAIQGLTAQQQVFIKSLLASKNFSPSEAAKEAGYKYPAQAGNSLMKNEVIRAAIGKELRLRKERLEWESDNVLSTLRSVIELDITELYDMDGNLSMESIKALPKHLRCCIDEIRTSRKFFTNEEGEREYYNQLEVKWMSKDQALHLALKHFGLLNDDLQVHVMDDKIKQKVIVELLGQVSEADNVIDTYAIEREAAKLPDVTRAETT